MIQAYQNGHESIFINPKDDFKSLKMTDEEEITIISYQIKEIKILKSSSSCRNKAFKQSDAENCPFRRGPIILFYFGPVGYSGRL